MIQILSLSPDDFNLAYTLEKHCHAFPWSKKNFFSNQGNHYLNFRLNIDNVMAAFVISKMVLNEATLFNIAVDPVYQRSGLGRQLLGHLIRALIQNGVETLWLEVRVSNDAAIMLYEKLGFNQVSVRNNYYPAAKGCEDALIMALTL